MGYSKWRREIAELAKEHGYTLANGTTGGGHLRLERPNRPPVFTSATPSCYRVFRNVRAQLRRAEREASLLT